MTTGEVVMIMTVITSLPVAVWSITISVFVCLFVCLSVCLFVCLSTHVSQKPHD